jgi:hypothetical protein
MAPPTLLAVPIGKDVTGSGNMNGASQKYKSEIHRTMEIPRLEDVSDKEA